MNFRATLTAFAFAASSYGAVISLHSSNSGISNLSVVETAGDITLTYDVTGTGPGVILFQRFTGGKAIIHNATNLTGVAIDRYAMELLDVLGDGDDGLDPLPYPAFVPVGFSTSNDFDGLTFGDPRSSSAFASILIDELTNARDFNDYFNGSVASGGAFTINHFLFPLVNHGDFLLFIRPNTSSVVPEPSTYAMIGAGIGALLIARRRR